MSQPLGAAKARELVRKAALPEVLEAALDALRDVNDPGLRDLVLERYRQLCLNPVRLDGGGKLRTVLLQFLRPVAEARDLEIFESSVLTVEIQYGGDTTQNLRAAALLGIAGIDEARGAWYAARLLQERDHTSPVTGQPALAAAQLLVSIGRPEPLYLEALRGGGHPEVRAECVRQLTDLPVPLLKELAAKILKGGDEPLLIGIVDLALAHPALAELVPDLRAWLLATDLVDVYRYLVTALAASRREEAVNLLRELRPLTTDPRKVPFLDGAIELLTPTAS